MTVHRLLKVHLPVAGEGIFAALSSVPYGDGRLSGFIVDRRRKECLEARFVEKAFFVDRLVNPEGEEESIERYEYRICDVTLFSDGINLYLKCDGRIPASLFSRFTEAFDFKFYYELLKIDVVEWARQIENVFSRRFVVSKIYIDNYPVAEGVTASVNVKGRGDVLEAARLKYGAIVDKAQKVEIRPMGDKGSIVLSSAASLRAQGPIGDDVIDVAVRVARSLATSA